jgi:TAT (twin-arginine translocation) pathway signal sequence/WD40-like Beta Propeller Repeat
MNTAQMTRRQMLKAAGAIGGMAAMGGLIGAIPGLADGEPGDAGLGPFGPWSEPQPVRDVPSTFNEFHPALSKDGLSLYFTTNRFASGTPPYPNAIVVVQRPHRKATWDLDSLVLVSSLNIARSASGAPNLTPKGHLIYFQNNQGGRGGDLYVSYRDDTRDDQGWSDMVLLPGAVNTPTNSESAATYFRDPADGTVRMYFSRFAGIGSFGNPNQDFNIFVSRMQADGTFGAGVMVPALNAVQEPGDAPGTWTRDTRTAIRRDGLEMFITSNRHGGLSYSGGSIENLWVATRAGTSTEDWSTPTLVSTVNTGLGEGGPALSFDARTLYFFSARTAAGTVGPWQLWTSTRESLA